MLSWSIALLAAFGFGDFVGVAIGISKILIFVFLVLFVANLVNRHVRPPLP